MKEVRKACCLLLAIENAISVEFHQKILLLLMINDDDDDDDREGREGLGSFQLSFSLLFMFL